MMTNIEFQTRCAVVTTVVSDYIQTAASWGVRDCVKMCADHAGRMGHKSMLPSSKPYGSARGALKALHSAGYETLMAAIDARFERIHPAMAWAGDLIALPSDIETLPALAISLPRGHAFQWHEGGFGITLPLMPLMGWRVPCLVMPHG